MTRLFGSAHIIDQLIFVWGVVVITGAREDARSERS